MAGHNNLENWRNHQRFRRIHNLTMAFIGMIMFIVVAGIFSIGILLYHAADEISDNGLKSVVERIWEGPDDEADEASQSD